MKQFSCKGHKGIATLKKCQSSEATSVFPKGGQRFDVVNLRGTERGDDPCNMASFTTE